MQLQQLIRETLNNPPVLVSTKGDEYTNIQKTYASIKSYLYLNHYTGAPVGIKLKKDVEYFLCMLACMDLGVPYVPMKDTFPQKRIEEINEDANFEVIIDANLLNKMKSSEVCHEFSYKEICQTSPLYIIFTSGSTGKPKGVEISHGAFEAYANWLCEYQAHIKSSDRFLQITEFTFDISLIDLIFYLYKKTPLYFSSFDGNIFRLAYELETYEINVTSTVPNNINMLLEEQIVSRVNLEKLHTLMIGGARFSYGLYAKVCKNLKGLDISNFYGPTEFTIYSHAHRICFDEKKDTIDSNVTIGTENNLVESSIYKEGQFLNDGERGELLLSGPQIMNGYKNNDAKTSEVILEIYGVKYYRTGDIAYKSEGNFFVVGRLDDTIKYRGYRINLLDIDSYIMQLDYISDVTTIAVPDEISENKTVSFVRLNGELDIDKIKKDLKDILLDYQIPQEFLKIETFPTNTSGKVCKKQLTEKYQEMEKR